MKNYTYEELKEQVTEFRKVFSNKEEIKDMLRRIADDKHLLEEKDIIAIEKMRLDLVYGIDNVKLSYEEIMNEIVNGNVSEEEKSLGHEYIMLSDDVIRLSNELIAIIDTIV